MICNQITLFSFLYYSYHISNFRRFILRFALRAYFLLYLHLHAKYSEFYSRCIVSSSTEEVIFILFFISRTHAHYIRYAFCHTCSLLLSSNFFRIIFTDIFLLKTFGALTFPRVLGKLILLSSLSLTILRLLIASTISFGGEINASRKIKLFYQIPQTEIFTG